MARSLEYCACSIEYARTKYVRTKFVSTKYMRTSITMSSVSLLIGLGGSIRRMYALGVSVVS